MLVGETANGKQPELAVSTMAGICRYAEVGINHNQAFNFVRAFTPKPVGTVESAVSSLAKNAVDIRPGMLVLFSEGGKMARLVAKYQPCAPVLVVTSNPRLARACSAYYACHPLLLDAQLADKAALAAAAERALHHGVATGLCVPGKEVVILASTAVTPAGTGHGAEREMFVTVAPGALDASGLGTLAPDRPQEVPEAWVAKTVSLRAARIDVAMVCRSSTVRAGCGIVSLRCLMALVGCCLLGNQHVTPESPSF